MDCVCQQARLITARRSCARHTCQVLSYMQLCEGHRTDVSVFNMPMMSYKWFKVHHDR